MSISDHPEGTWRALVAVMAVSITFACVLVVFESLFVGVTFGLPLAPEVCRVGSGVWVGIFGAMCAAIVLVMLCRRKDDFGKSHTVWFCVGICSLAVVADCALMVLEILCLMSDTKSPLPIFLLSASGVHVLCSVSALASLYLLWKSTVIAEKTLEEKKLSPLDHHHMIVIPNILKSYPSFVSIELN